MNQIKKSLILSGHKTSIALEKEFWIALEKISKKQNIDVGLLTGDRSINSEANLIIATTEILRNMIRKHYDLMKPTNTNLQTSATVTPTGEKTRLASAINQPMDDEGGETIFLQRVNNIQYVPFPVTA